MLKKIFTIACFVLIITLCLFQVGNTDFWWHIKAGQLLREFGWIHTDPFAFTRIGEPYLASHPWLAQIILSLVYDLTGASGITVLRILFVVLTLSIPLLLDRRNLWINSGIAVLAAIGMRASITDRPQLFTFLCFSIVIALCCIYLQLASRTPSPYPSPYRERAKILLYLPIIILLWTNLHGAASLTGVALFGALALQRLWNKPSEWKPLTLCGVAMCAALFITPSGGASVKYLITLLTEPSAALIAEWQPVTWSRYIFYMGPLWIITISSIALGRKHLLFSVLVLVGFGYLSRTAGRHEALFAITALAVSIYQLHNARGWNHILEKLSARRITCTVTLIVIFFSLAFHTTIQSIRFTITDGTLGLGTFAPMRGASDFIHHKGITGNMFNTYNAGGELLFHDHKVFLDGRNIDYGHAYIKSAVDAGEDPALWKELEDQHQFTHAVIYYALEGHHQRIPYVHILEIDPSWTLSYLDDWAAVYLKDNQQHALQQITPRMLYRTEMPESITLRNLAQLKAEINRIIILRPDSIKARQYLEELEWAFAR